MNDEKNTVEEIKAVAAQSTDVGELQAMLDGEDRSTARKAITDRIEELTAGAVTVLDDNPADTIYSRDDLVGGAEGFGTTGAGMSAALKLAGLTEATRADAQKAVDAFNEREV